MYIHNVYFCNSRCRKDTGRAWSPCEGEEWSGVDTTRRSSQLRKQGNEWVESFSSSFPLSLPAAILYTVVTLHQVYEFDLGEVFNSEIWPKGGGLFMAVEIYFTRTIWTWHSSLYREVVVLEIGFMIGLRELIVWWIQSVSYLCTCGHAEYGAQRVTLDRRALLLAIVMTWFVFLWSRLCVGGSPVT